MSTNVSTPARRRHRRSTGRTAVGLSSVLALLAGLLTVSAGPAVAGPVDAGWAASGPGTVDTVSDGATSAASMTYDLDAAGLGTDRSWNFTTTATETSADGPITVPWTWKGLHAWYQVTAKLEMVVNGEVVGPPLVDAGPADCCTTPPSNGFLYGGTAGFDVDTGDTYGFRLTGSNRDTNNLLRGTLTLSTRPYLDATIGSDNRQWIGAADLPEEAGVDGALGEPGEARWFRFPVVPGQRVSVELDGLPADYDLALYGDIEDAFDRLSAGDDVTQLAAASASGAPGAGDPVPTYPEQVTEVPTSADELPSATFAPRIYAPRIYAPRIYAPRIYAPRIYAPRIYAPRIYAPDSYVPELASDPAFRDAFSAAQNQTLLAVSANTGKEGETVSASTGNTDGHFYVRVQGHAEDVSSADDFHLSRTTSGGEACAGLSDFADVPTLAPTRSRARTVVVTDTRRVGLVDEADTDEYVDSLQRLAAATDGAVVDVAGSDRVQALQDQASGHLGCPYAVNLVAEAIKDIVDSYRNPSSAYVVIAGGDEVVPFFRTPDLSGLGEESQFEPPVLPDSAAGASLAGDQVLSQDAYGSDAEVTLGGATLPVPDLAVGRLVKTPDEIESAIDHYLGLDGGTLPTPSSSLVTGYDFLADAADRVGDEFAAALPDGTSDELIAESGKPREESWTGTDLEEALLGEHHDLVYLAGHFSANDTLAADFETTFDASLLDPDYDGGVNAGKLTDTIVLSAGCHSGYNIVDGAAVPERTNTFDWTQRMAQQQAVLIGGTGYQYGDTDFLAYSERLYLDIARRLHEGPVDGDAEPIAVGSALVKAKQDYLASLGTVTGIDQKAMLEATLYGLPMTGFDAPGRSPLGADVFSVSPELVSDGPGETLGLGVDDIEIDTDTARGTKPSGAGEDLPAELSWLNGTDGVTAHPGAPALPKQVEDVSVEGKVLRGVGFRGGDYTDTSGLLPLTGAPAIEGSTPNTTFESEAFFPQRLATPNYFGALGGSGRTSLVLTPAQYRTDDEGGFTNTERAYSGLDLRLFYSDEESTAYGANEPALAAPPSIGDVHGTVSDGTVAFSARVTGDPSAGVQQVWVTWTGSGGDSGRGSWRSVDLSQDPLDSTRWTGTLDLDGQSAEGMRFLVQAANGIGAVALDTAEGDGYRVTEAGGDDAVIELLKGAPTEDSPFGVQAFVSDPDGQGVPERTVLFTVSRSGEELFEYAGQSDDSGTAALRLPPDQALPSGRLTIEAELLDDSGAATGSDSREVMVEIGFGPEFLATRAGTAYPDDPRLRAEVSVDGQPVPGIPVTFTLPEASQEVPGATFPSEDGDGRLQTVTRRTGPDGVAEAPPPTAGAAIGTFLATIRAGTENADVPIAAQYALTPFERPVVEGGITTVNGKRALPVKTSLLLADDSLLDDRTAAALVEDGRVQVRWRPHGDERWTASTELAKYDVKGHRLLAKLTASRLGIEPGTTYQVTLRVLPAVGEPQPEGEDRVNGSFDLGSRTFKLRVR